MGVPTVINKKDIVLFWTKLLSRKYQFALDLAVLTTAFALTYLLRFDFAVPEQWVYVGLGQLPLILLIQFSALLLTGAYTLIWRYTGMSDIKVFIRAGVGAMLPLLLMRLLLPDALQSWRVPLSIIVVDTLLAFGGVLTLRVLRRALYERYEKHYRRAQIGGIDRKAVLLVGAGRAGVMAAKEIDGRGNTGLEVKGFVDDDPYKQGAIINRVKVLGTTSDLPELVRKHQIEHVVITLAQASGREIRKIVDVCEQIPIKVRIIPGLYDILQGKVQISNFRDVQIEDLLGREAVRFEEREMREFLSGKVIMITGAGGSIGSELVRQVALFSPKNLLLVERAEFGLFNIERELRQHDPNLNIVALIADVCDEGRMHAIFSAYQPQVIIHAAAHKHVPLMEANPCEAVKNNILGTRVLGDLAGSFDAESFVLISTDKAVSPTSVMGASKRVAEIVVQDLNHQYATRFLAVRFGNVIGSNGSVIPIFQEQIRKGGPLTVTDENMVRYFLSIPEAVQLVLQASAMGRGGEIFILDMGEPVRILDLARDIISLSGLRPYEDIDIQITGIRPGEKLSEELNSSDEQLDKTRHPKIFIGNIAAYPPEQVREALDRLGIMAACGQEQLIRKLLNEFLPEACLKVGADALTPHAEAHTHPYPLSDQIDQPV
jgi:FlaA1/EpsC-like NDP-sugar epimerase